MTQERPRQGFDAPSSTRGKDKKHNSAGAHDVGDLGRESRAFLEAVVNAASPSGYEMAVADIYRDYIGAFVDEVLTDDLGNVSGVINPGASTHIMLAGHMDEIGFMVHHIDENGFIHMSSVGGNDSVIPVAQRVWVHGREKVAGVVGRKPMQLFTAADQSQAPKTKDLWIDIGSGSKQETEELISLGDVITIQSEFAPLRGNRAVGRAFDNKAGLAIVAQVLRLLKEAGGLHPDVGVYGLGTVQEEIGSRGAQVAAFKIRPKTALAIDMGVAMDFPRAVASEKGEFYLGKGPGIARGPNTNHRMFRMLVDAAVENSIPYQIIASPGTSPTDARVMQVSGGGAATALLSLPLRYMHSPSEVIDMADLQSCVELMAAYCRSVTPDTDFTPRLEDIHRG